MSEPPGEPNVTVELAAVVVCVQDDAPHVLTVDVPGATGAALPSGPLEHEDRTLQSGVRKWVEAQTAATLGYVEQLYTFGDRVAPGPGAWGGRNDRAERIISIGYLALLFNDGAGMPIQGRWRSWYEFFPWEDHRDGDPAMVRRLRGALDRWARSGDPALGRHRLDRIRAGFGVEGGEDTGGGDGGAWNEERALDRYELLFEAGLVDEALAGPGGARPPAADARPGTALGVPLHADHRRILATAVSRLRAKIKYRPLLFELMPQTFTFFQLQKTVEALSGIRLHKQNFRRLVAQQGLVEETGKTSKVAGGRPAKLLRFRAEVTLERPTSGIRVMGRPKIAS